MQWEKVITPSDIIINSYQHGKQKANKIRLLK